MGFWMRGKDNNYLLCFWLEKDIMLQLWDDFVENSRNPAGAFNKQIIKSVYYDCKKFNWCFKISKVDHIEQTEMSFCVYFPMGYRATKPTNQANFLLFKFSSLGVHVRWIS